VSDRSNPVEDLHVANGAMLVIISGPSGVGKDTIIDALRRRPHDPEYHYVVTCTTRAMRPGEVDGVDYHFLSAATFAAQRAAGEFLEATRNYKNWYGTPRSEVGCALAGRDVILKIDVRAPRSSRRRSRRPPHLHRPPSLEDLFQRRAAARRRRPTSSSSDSATLRSSWRARRTTTTS
jgi:guanylate kinase